MGHRNVTVMFLDVKVFGYSRVSKLIYSRIIQSQFFRGMVSILALYMVSAIPLKKPTHSHMPNYSEICECV